MIWEAIGSAALGLLLAHAATRRLPGRLPHRALVLSTGAVAALLGGVVSAVVLGPGRLAVSLLCALAVSAAILSLLLRVDAEPRAGRQPVVRPLGRVGPAGSTGPAGAAGTAGTAARAVPGVRQPSRGQPSASYGPR
ncbi:hypothetical protein G5C65_17065 [Streptomyces sp. SB3404]|uniref:Integral membrane protein n=1 Tax=Streptomyces boncukensis TaxID=2711219 RepID=A0A6G4WZV1_9ACTN|nr:hypothetical protein [Streptomyces boncukensis]